MSEQNGGRMPASRAAAVAPTSGPASAAAFAPERWIAPQRGGIRARLADDGGAATAEYAITIMAVVDLLEQTGCHEHETPRRDLCTTVCR